MVFDKIKEIISEQTGIKADEITMEMNVKEDLDADSLDLFQIINDIEDEYDITFDDPEGMTTVGEVVEYVEKKVEA